MQYLKEHYCFCREQRKTRNSSPLVYATGRDKVSDVWVAGKQLLRNKALTTMDTEEILSCAREWRNRIAESDSQ